MVLHRGYYGTHDRAQVAPGCRELPLLRTDDIVVARRSSQASKPLSDHESLWGLRSHCVHGLLHSLLASDESLPCTCVFGVLYFYHAIWRVLHLELSEWSSL